MAMLLLCLSLLFAVLPGAARAQPSRPGAQPLSTEAPVSFPDQPIVTLNTTGAKDIIGTVSQPTTFANPVGQSQDRQQFRLEVCSDEPQPIAWGDKWQTKYGLPLPHTTRGGKTCDLWGWRFHREEGAWFFIATTPPGPAPSPRRGR